MEPKKNLTLNGISGTNLLFILNAVCMIAVSIYLTTHFYDTLFPTKLGGAGSLCDLSSFFNCDAATYSKISNIAGIPISFFGIIVGFLFLFTSLMPSEALEKTSSAVSKYNFIGCLGLFVYSLIALGSLCPFCTLYYLFSFVAFLLLYKFGLNSWSPEPKTSGLWLGILAIGSFFMFQTTSSKASTQSKLNQSIVEQFEKLADLGEPDVESPYKIHMASESFNNSPIRISVFSDFQCPFCKIVAEQMPDLIRRYPKHVSVQYFFYPLDNKCNSNVKSRFHANACDAAIIAACDEKKFEEVHDEIFQNQAKLPDGILTEIAKKHSLSGCLENSEILNKVITSLNQGAKFNLKSTPTIILNGKKIEGSIPTAQYFAIFDHILKEKK